MKMKVMCLFVILAIMAVACSKNNNSNTHTVKYTVSGSAKLSVTYSDKNFVAQTATGVDSTWTYTFTTSTNGQVVHLAIASVDSSSVGGRIFIDNQQSTQNNGSSSITLAAQIP